MKTRIDLVQELHDKLHNWGIEVIGSQSGIVTSIKLSEQLRCFLYSFVIDNYSSLYYREEQMLTGTISKVKIIQDKYIQDKVAIEWPGNWQVFLRGERCDQKSTNKYFVSSNNA